MNALENLLNKHILSTKTKGDIYKKLAEISFQKDDITYVNYITKSKFYYEKIGEEEELIYLLSDYGIKLYTYGSYNEALNIYNQILSYSKFETISSEEKLDIYLKIADLYIRLSDFSNARKYLDLSYDTYRYVNQTNYIKLKYRKYETLEAFYLFQNSELDDALQILKDIDVSDTLGYEVNSETYIKNFYGLYNEIYTRYYILCNQFENAKVYLDEYLKLTETTGLNILGLRLLNSFNDATGNDKNYEAYQTLYNKLTEEYLKKVNESYAISLSELITLCSTQIIKEEKRTQTINALIISIFSILCALLLIYTFLIIIFDYFVKDPLTTLYNRKAYEAHTIKCNKHKIAHYLLMIDIDNFKNVNDTFGHPVGDKVLRAVAGVLKAYESKNTLIFRFGGEEICLMLFNITDNMALTISDEIREKISKLRFQEGFSITVSEGLAKSKNGESVLIDADQALYQSKNNGKNCLTSKI